MTNPFMPPPQIDHRKLPDVEGLDGVHSEQSRALVRDLGAVDLKLSGWWALTPQSWRCWCCDRSKREIAHLSGRSVYCNLVSHHDHICGSGDPSRLPIATVSVVDLLTNPPQAHEAFPPTVICHACNIADSDAKRIVGAPSPFSFAPYDIKRMIRPRPGTGSHEIDAAAARSVWAEREPEFAKRVTLIDSRRRYTPEEATWRRLVPLAYQADVVRAEAGRILAGVPDLTTGFMFNTGSWEACAATPYPYLHRSSKVSKSPPTQAAIEALKDTPAWKKVPDDWICPCCRRTKLQTVQRTQRKPAIFGVVSIPASRTREHLRNSFRAPEVEVCQACALVRYELVRKAKVHQHNVCMDFVTQIIVPAPHAYHETDPLRMASVIERLRECASTICRM